VNNAVTNLWNHTSISSPWIYGTYMDYFTLKFVLYYSYIVHRGETRSLNVNLTDNVICYALQWTVNWKPAQIIKIKIIIITTTKTITTLALYFQNIRECRNSEYVTSHVFVSLETRILHLVMCDVWIRIDWVLHGSKYSSCSLVFMER
jgi:hypothetical protein